MKARVSHDESGRRTPDSPLIDGSSCRLPNRRVSRESQIVVCREVHDLPAIERDMGSLRRVEGSQHTLQALPVELLELRRQLRSLEVVPRHGANLDRRPGSHKEHEKEAFQTRATLLRLHDDDGSLAIA